MKTTYRLDGTRRVRSTNSTRLSRAAYEAEKARQKRLAVRAMLAQPVPVLAVRKPETIGHNPRLYNGSAGAADWMARNRARNAQA